MIDWRSNKMPPRIGPDPASGVAVAFGNRHWRPIMRL
jgi:hypothetical protein